MSTYLNGYLSSIPKSEYEEIINFLKQIIDNKSHTDNFNELLEELKTNTQLFTEERVISPNEKVIDTYNDFFSKASIDLNYLFKIIDSLYKTLENFSYLSSSHLSNIESELIKLEQKLEEIILQKENSDTTTIRSESFKNTSSFEKYDNSTSYLFTDRDDSPLIPINLVHNNKDDMIVLNINESNDLLHNKEGKTIARLDVVDYRGIPEDTYAIRQFAIDNSDTTYWDCTTITDNKIKNKMDNLEASGAYVKFKIRLCKKNPISEISLTPYCIYPVEISKITIEGVNILSNIVSSTETMTFNFAPIVSDEIEVVLRQKNYLRGRFTENSKLNEATELLNLAIGNKKESHTNKSINKSDYNDDNIFSKKAKEKKDELKMWNERFIREG